jgi:thiamine biosynthesis lipoprotein
MGTVFEVRAEHPDPAYAAQAAQAAFALVDRLEQDLSRFLPNSDVARVNALGAGEAVRVSPATFECLQLARALHAQTDGAFDVSLGTGLERLELADGDLAVRAREAGARLDLGGLGKGYAVDRMAELLLEWGLERAVVHGGHSSVVVLDPPAGREGWDLALRVPWPGDDRVVARLCVRRTALSASGTRKEGHIVDPGTGRPAPARASFVALPRDGGLRSPAAVAEGLSTALVLLGEGAAASLCAHHPRADAWLAFPAEGDGAPRPIRLAVSQSPPVEPEWRRFRGDQA